MSKNYCISIKVPVGLNMVVVFQVLDCGGPSTNVHKAAPTSNSATYYKGLPANVDALMRIYSDIMERRKTKEKQRIRVIVQCNMCKKFEHEARGATQNNQDVHYAKGARTKGECGAKRLKCTCCVSANQ